MPPTSPLRHTACWALAASLLAAITLTAGCATSSVTPAAPEPEVVAPQRSDNELIPVVRYGRYTLVELLPAAAQRELLQQVVDVSIPNTMDATVGDALRYVLLRSGYQLCQPRDDAGVLYALPLPTAHFRLGPLPLRDALLTLAGPAWALQVDDVPRHICFARHLDADVHPTSPPADTPNLPSHPATPFPLPEVRP